MTRPRNHVLFCAARRHGQSGEARHGISLVEIMMVVLILAILAAAAVPHVYRSAGRYGIDAAAGRVVLDLNLARKLAVMNSANRSVEFSANPLNSYLLPGISGLVNPAVDYEVRLGESPYGATIDSATFGGDNVVVFNGHGFPDSDGSVVIRAGQQQRTITLETNGEVTVQ